MRVVCALLVDAMFNNSSHQVEANFVTTGRTQNRCQFWPKKRGRQRVTHLRARRRAREECQPNGQMRANWRAHADPTARTHIRTRTFAHAQTRTRTQSNSQANTTHTTHDKHAHTEIATFLKSEIVQSRISTWRRAFSLTCMAYGGQEASGA